jgi:pyruvate/2-oxoglutarate dehydrogenase complex dihydrolipoamide acyltransferase (E2) component
MTLAERLEFILKQNNWNAGVWARRAKLHRSHVYGLIKAAREGDTKKLAYETARKLARAAGVSVEWLAEGIGTPDDAFIEQDDEDEDDDEDPAIQALSLPKRRAREAALALELPGKAIAHGLREPDGYPSHYYFKAMELAAERLRGGSRGETPVPPPPPPSKTNLGRP